MCVLYVMYSTWYVHTYICMYVCIHLRIVHIERVLYVNIVLLYAAVIVWKLYAAVTYYTVIVTSVWV